jgi:hypothetical protein
MVCRVRSNSPNWSYFSSEASVTVEIQSGISLEHEVLYRFNIKIVDNAIIVFQGYGDRYT